MTTQDPELSAALGWPGGISDPVLDRKVLLQQVAALRAALAQQAEPVAQFDLNTMPGQADAHLRALLRYTENFYATAIEHGMRAGPTANAIAHVERAGKALHQIVHAQAKMLEPARPVEPVEPVEPVGWNWMLDGQPYGQAYYGNPPDTDIAERAATAGRTVRLLYTAPPPPQRQPLTEEEIESCRQQGYAHAGLSAPFDFGKAARAVERAHGIKE